MYFLDLFSGIGGFRLGMEQAGHTCVGHVEIDKFANISYEAIHKPKEEEFHATDITKVTDDEWRSLSGAVDVICGGFPCQAFSIAGRRRGFQDTRGTLFFEVARAAKQIKSRILFLENVKGLLSHDKGETFRVILSTLDEIGYDAEWEVLNSKDFGVPQNRERVFIIGHLRGTGGREVFPIGHYGKKTNEKRKLAANTITARYEGNGVGSYIVESKQKGIKQFGNINKTDYFGGNTQTSGVYSPLGISPCLSTMQGGGQEPKIVVVENTQKIYGLYSHESERFKKKPLKNISRTLKANKHDASVTIPVLTPDRENKRQNGRRFKKNGEPMFTLTGQDRHGLFDGYDIRKLTPRECWRLQGFPDWAFDRAKGAGVSDSQLYKQAGNSVTVNVIYEIAKRLK